jgi:phenylalanyl-tRNA synthetase beta chain
MKISYNYLKTLVDFPYTPSQLGEILTSTGLEVEAIEKMVAFGGGLEGLVIGQVVDCQKHPDADKLHLTKVDIGQETLLDIVCGAPNVAQGQKVVVATVGAVLHPAVGEPFTIKKSKIRGKVSEGMLCAEDEIGIGDSHAGIIVLETTLPLGTPVAEYYQIKPDYQIEIGLTPNRADAASHYGVARDIKAVGQFPLQLPDVSSFQLGATPHTIELQVENIEACPRFCGLEIRGVEVKESPDWLKGFLRTIGLNPINNIVDITNYVCHYLGQPMHIFDADQIAGQSVIVKVPAKDTSIVTLDNVERKLSGFDLAICSTDGPMAIAGVFGGVHSGVSSATKNIFLEVAYFNPTAIRKTATFHGLKTDASFRYERGTDPHMPPFAIRYAAILVQQLAGGQICDFLFDNYPEPVPNFIVTVKYKNIDRLIGKSIERDQIIRILESLDIKIISRTDEALVLSVPPYRVDVFREADVIEEILRIYGFENVELSEHLSSNFISDFPEKDNENLGLKLSEALVSVGHYEVQNLSIVKPSENAFVTSDASQQTIRLLNPLSEELSEMRKSLVFSGLNTLLYNINRRNKDLKVFEFGRTYHKVALKDQEPKIKESRVLGIWHTGNQQAESWADKSKVSDFQGLAQVVAKVLAVMKIDKYEIFETENKIFSYGLDYRTPSKMLVSFGALTPQLLSQADVKNQVFYAEFDWDLLTKSYSSEVKFAEIPKFPEVRRDLSLVIDKSVKFIQIEKLAKATERKLLKSLNVFDVYEGQKLGDNQKSYAVSFILQDAEKTLNEAQIDKTMQKLMQAFEKEIGAQIRK